jgi:hypothetical protein
MTEENTGNNNRITDRITVGVCGSVHHSTIHKEKSNEK